MSSMPGERLGPQPLKQFSNCPSTSQKFLGRKFVRVARVHDVEICFELWITGPVLNGVTMLWISAHCECYLWDSFYYYSPESSSFRRSLKCKLNTKFQPKIKWHWNENLNSKFMLCKKRTENNFFSSSFDVGEKRTQIWHFKADEMYT